MITIKELDKEIEKRQKFYIVKNKIDLIVLSCKRWHALKKLIESLKKLEKYPLMEKVLVDNGSGRDLLDNVHTTGFFNRIIACSKNLGIVGALRDAYTRTDGEYILLIEDDFILDNPLPFLNKCLNVFEEYPEIGIIRLKKEDNPHKPFRIIASLRKTSKGIEFWTWLPKDGLNGWCAGSVIFKRISYLLTGELPDIRINLPRIGRFHQGYIYECVYGRKYNKHWLAARIKNCYPFSQTKIDKCPDW